MFNELLQFAIGIGLLLICTNFIIAFSEKISLALKISPLVIGLTIVSIGTALPEFTVSTLAALKNDSGLAMGNIVGTVITNSFLVFSVGILFSDLRIGTTKTLKSAVIFLASGILFLALQLGNYPKMFTGLLLAGSAFLYTLGEFQWGITGRTLEDRTRFRRRQRISVSPMELPLMLAAVLGIIIGGTMSVSAVENLSRITGLSTTLFGLTLTAVATSLPELATAIIAGKNKSEKIAIGNILGSNIYNMLLIGGVVFFYSRENFGITMVNWGFFTLSIVILAAVIFTYRGKTVPKMIAVSLIALYFLYLLFLQL